MEKVKYFSIISGISIAIFFVFALALVSSHSAQALSFSDSSDAGITATDDKVRKPKSS